MEGKNSDEQLLEAVKAGKPVIIKTCKLNKETEEYILHVLELFLEYIGKQKILDQLSYCVRELLNNAKKANTKRVFFADEKLNIENPTDYRKGMILFREKTLRNIDHYLEMQKKENLYIQVYFKIKDSFLFIVISNNSPILSVEKERIYSKIKKAKSFRSVEETFQTVLDDSEGAGLGILILILMFRKIGISEKHIEFISDKKLTHVKIDVPLSLIAREDGEMLSEELVKEIDSIPPFPAHIQEITRIMENENVDLKDLTEIIRKDPGLTIDLLKMVNSALFKRINKIERIDIAISIVGMKGIKYLIQSYGIQKVLKGKYDKKIQEEIWGHCHRVANIAVFLCKMFHFQELEDHAYICGLLHDVGKIVMLSLHKGSILKMQEYCKQKGLRKGTLESLFTDSNSFLIGTKMIEKWNLMPELIYVISHQVDPYTSDSENASLVKIVYLANVLDNILTKNGEELEYADQILEEFGLNEERKFYELTELMNREVI